LTRLANLVGRESGAGSGEPLTEILIHTERFRSADRIGKEVA